jgi:hypothetical protein
MSLRFSLIIVVKMRYAHIDDDAVLRVLDARFPFLFRGVAQVRRRAADQPEGRWKQLSLYASHTRGSVS